MYKELKECFKMPCQIGNKNKKKEIIIKNQIEILELRSTETKIKIKIKKNNGVSQ